MFFDFIVEKVRYLRNKMEKGKSLLLGKSYRNKR